MILGENEEENPRKNREFQDLSLATVCGILNKDICDLRISQDGLESEDEREEIEINRINDNRLAKIAKNGKPVLGQHPKCWCES